MERRLIELLFILLTNILAVNSVGATDGSRRCAKILAGSILRLDSTQVVEPNDVLRNLKLIREMPGVTELGGVFGPDSVLWEVAKEDNLDLFSGVIGYTELLHPGAVQGFFDHSKVFKNPAERMKRTIRIISTMIYGTLSEAERLAVGLNRGHSYVTGKMPFSTGY